MNVSTHINGTREWLFGAATRRAADLLHYAASPTFAVMALLTGASGDGAEQMLCSPAHGSSSLAGMGAMYLLMSAFHSRPWLKLVSGGQGGTRHS
jgi:hypothetical protein